MLVALRNGACRLFWRLSDWSLIDIVFRSVDCPDALCVGSIIKVEEATGVSILLSLSLRLEVFSRLGSVRGAVLTLLKGTLLALALSKTVAFLPSA